MKNLNKGFLIVFEGIDGAGKTTQAKLLFDRLNVKGFDVVLTKEPTDSVYGQKIRTLAKEGRGSVSAEYEYNLFLSDRRIHVEQVIKPALAQKRVVILDRYYYSSIAYQGALGLDPQSIKSENELFAPVPEIVIILDVPPRVGLRRIEKSRNEQPNLFEQEENLTRVRALFDDMREEPYCTH